MSKVSEDIFSNGRWLQRSFQNGKYTWTVSGSRWNNIKDRCNPNSFLQVREPTYKGALNLFNDWDDFVNWSISQKGYSCKNYEVDSDILSTGTKIYSKDTCVFIPGKLNKFLQSRPRNKSSNLPEGLHITERNPNIVIVKITSWFFGTQTLGRFPISKSDVAHEVYLKEKNRHRECWLNYLIQNEEVDQRVIDYMSNMRFTKQGKQIYE